MAELIINLWAIYDTGSGLVYGLAGRAYHVKGNDKHKLAVLRGLARTDHVTAKRYRLPARFNVVRRPTGQRYAHRHRRRSRLDTPAGATAWPVTG